MVIVDLECLKGMLSNVRGGRCERLPALQRRYPHLPEAWALPRSQGGQSLARYLWVGPDDHNAWRGKLRTKRVGGDPWGRFPTQQQGGHANNCAAQVHAPSHQCFNKYCALGIGRVKGMPQLVRTDGVGARVTYRKWVTVEDLEQQQQQQQPQPGEDLCAVQRAVQENLVS